VREYECRTRCTKQLDNERYRIPEQIGIAGRIVDEWSQTNRRCGKLVEINGVMSD